MGSQRRRQLCALLTAVLCLAPLAAAKAYAGTHHFALSVPQAKVCAGFASILHLCFLQSRSNLAAATCSAVSHPPLSVGAPSPGSRNLVVECLQARDRFPAAPRRWHVDTCVLHSYRMLRQWLFGSAWCCVVCYEKHVLLITRFVPLCQLDSRPSHTTQAQASA